MELSAGDAELIRLRTRIKEQEDENETARENLISAAQERLKQLKDWTIDECTCCRRVRRMLVPSLE